MEAGVPYRYRDYRREPLSRDELRELLRQLGRSPGELLRRHDRVAKQLGLGGDESDEELLSLMAEHPTLLQRPIGRLGERAVVGRPPEALLGLVAPGRGGRAP